MEILNNNGVRIALLIIICIVAFIGGMYYCESNKKEHFNIGKPIDTVAGLLNKRQSMASRKIGNGICVPSPNNRYREVRFNNNTCKDICSKYNDCVGYTESSEGKKINYKTNNSICSNICFGGIQGKIPRGSLCNSASVYHEESETTETEELDCHTKYKHEQECQCISSPSCHIFIKDGYSRNILENNEIENVTNDPNIYSEEICNTSSRVTGITGLPKFPPLPLENIQCAAHYDTVEPCCRQKGEKGEKASSDKICPVTAPTCNNYVFNKQWGTCSSK